MKTGLLLISSYRRAMAALYGLLARRWKTSFYLYLAALFTLSGTLVIFWAMRKRKWL